MANKHDRVLERVADLLGELRRRNDVEQDLKKPFLAQTQSCAHDGLDYATALMLCVCMEAYLRLLAQRVEKADRNLIPEFATRFNQKIRKKKKNKERTEEEYKKEEDGGDKNEDEKEEVKGYDNIIPDNKIEKLRKHGGVEGELSFRELLNIFAEMGLIQPGKSGTATPSFSRASLLELFKKTRHKYAHANFAEIKNISNDIKSLLKLWETGLNHPIQSIRLNSASLVIEYIFGDNNVVPPSDYFGLLPESVFGEVAARTLNEILEPRVVRRVSAFRDFWRLLCQQASGEERAKIENSFLMKLEQFARGEIIQPPEVMSELIHWSGSESFVQRCADCLLQWMRAKLEVEIDLAELDHLLNFVRSFRDEGNEGIESKGKFPASRQAELRELIAATEAKIAAIKSQLENSNEPERLSPIAVE